VAILTSGPAGCQDTAGRSDVRSENHISLEAVWAHLEWCRLLREYGWGKKAKKTLLSNLRPSPEIEALWAGTTTAEEDAALEASVTATGPVHAITADEQGNIIDGHRRYRIYKKHGVKEVFVTVLNDLTDEQKRHLAVSLNAHRRHLTLDQKKEVVRKLLMENPRLSARRLGRLVGMDHHTAQGVKDRMIAGGEIPHLEIEGRDGKTYKARGAITPLQHIKRTLKQLSEVRELPALVTPKKLARQIAKERREDAARAGAATTRKPSSGARSWLGRCSWSRKILYTINNVARKDVRSEQVRNRYAAIAGIEALWSCAFTGRG
jgi:hypothetical protein